MSMLDYYEGLDNERQQQVQKCNIKIQNKKPNKPFAKLNLEGEQKGYFWYYGDLINLKFDIYGEVVIEDNAILYQVSGQKPDLSTQGELNQRAYNIIDYKSWTCTSIDEDEYNWVQDDEFIMPELGRNVFIIANNFLLDKRALLRFYDFRGNIIFEKAFKAEPTINLNLNEEESKTFIRGNYTCTLTIFNDHFNETIISEDDAIFSVR